MRKESNERKYLLVSHGTLAIGMKDAVNMIVGELMSIEAICLAEDSNIVEFEQKVRKFIDENEPDELIVLADIQGGSPFSKTVEILGEKNLLSESHVIAGMNLPLLVELAFMQDMNQMDQLIKKVRGSIKKFELTNDEDEEL